MKRGRERTGMTTMQGQELKRRGVSSGGDAATTKQTPRRQKLARAVVAAVVFGMLTALWTILWIRSAPVP
jgi:hypothetical protein